MVFLDHILFEAFAKSTTDSKLQELTAYEPHLRLLQTEEQLTAEAVLVINNEEDVKFRVKKVDNMTLSNQNKRFLPNINMLTYLPELFFALFKKKNVRVFR